MKSTTLSLALSVLGFVLLLGPPAEAQLLTRTLTAVDRELFTFTTPTGTAAKTVVAKFATEDPPGAFTPLDPLDDLRFELETAPGPGTSSQVLDKEFRISEGNVDALDGLNTQAVQLRAEITSETTPSGFRILKIRARFQYAYNFVTPETWAIRAKSLAAGTVHFLGFSAEGPTEPVAEAGATKPHLIEYIDDGSGNPAFFNFAAFVDLPTTKNLAFGPAHVNASDAFAQTESYQFINVGTAPLPIIGVAPVSLPAGPYSATPYFSAPVTVLPMAAMTGTLFKFKPTTAGPAADVAITLNTSATAIPQLKINLTGGVGIRLKTALLLDVSGSMLDDVHGIPTAVEASRKIFKARDAARYFVDVYRLNVPEAEMGLFTYPNLSGVCPGASTVVNFDKISDAPTFEAIHDQRLSRNHSSRLAPPNYTWLTPMTDGLELVRSSLASVPAHTRRMVFMVGDGQQYCPGSTLTLSGLKGPLQSSEIKFYTVPYGDDQVAWTQQFKDIASWTGGQSFPVNLDNEDSLKKRAENAIREVLGLETLTDPDGAIQRNQLIRDKVCVPEDEYVLNFLVRWQNSVPGALSVVIETPEGERIDQTTAATRPNDVGYFETESYAGFCIRGSYLAGRKGVGDWWINLTGTGVIAPGASVPFAYSVYSQSSLKSGFKINPWFTTLASAVTLHVGDSLHAVRSVERATLEYRAPTVAFGTWLATAKVDPDRILSLSTNEAGEPRSLAERKLWVLNNVLQQPYDPKWETRVVELSPDARASHAGLAAASTSAASPEFPTGATAYSAALETARVPGSYEFLGRLSGVTLRGDCFQREISTVHRVELHLNPDLIAKALRTDEVRIGPFHSTSLAERLRKGPGENQKYVAVSFTPRDELGNYAGPGVGDRIALDAVDAKVLEEYVDNLDGSFTYYLQQPLGADPAVSISFAGVSNAPVRLSVLSGTAPRLEISRLGGGALQLTWSSTNAVLEEASVLSTNWKPSEVAVESAPPGRRAKVEPVGAARYFRLRQP